MSTTIKEQRDNKIAELEMAQAETQLKAYKKLSESIDRWHEVPVSGYQLRGNDPIYGTAYPPMPRLYTSISDRTDGRFLPYYETESDLRRMRARARGLAAFTSTAISAMESLKNYVIGPGCNVDVNVKEDGNESFADLAKEILEETFERNDFVGLLDAEIHNTAREDGDTFVCLYESQDDPGEIDIEINDAEQCREPQDPRPLEEFLGVTNKMNAWWYGVHTQFDLKRQKFNWRPLGYHFVYTETGDEWDYIEADRCQQWKHNVPHFAPRGISDYVAVDGDLSREEKLRKNTAEGAAIQAAIAFVREHAPGVTKDAVSSMLTDNSVLEFDRNVLTGTKRVQVEKFQPGTVKDIPNGMKYHAGPMGMLRSPVFVEIAQFMLRSIGIRWIFPEYMISGDASNANFASTLVAESPFVKARETDQKFERTNIRKLCWKILKMAHGMGRFKGADWEAVKASIEILIDLPEVASRDKLALAQTNQILHNKGLLSLHTWAAQADLDYDEEQQLREDEPDPMEMQMAMIGMQDPGQEDEDDNANPPKRKQPKPNEKTRESLARTLDDNWDDFEGRRFAIVEAKEVQGTFNFEADA